MIENQIIISVLKRHHYGWPPKKAEREMTFSHLIIVSLGRQRLHDSGYPYIQVLGVDDYGGNLYDLGEHDIIRIRNISMNVDSLGSNIFRILPDKPLVLSTDPANIAGIIEITEDYSIR